jgi:hypothetical protein
MNITLHTMQLEHFQMIGITMNYMLKFQFTKESNDYENFKTNK